MPVCPTCGEDFAGQFCPHDGTPLLRRGDRSGEVLQDRYRLLERAGVGGMGEVYRAEMLALGRPVAVKLLLPALARDGEAVERLRREALSAGGLDHPNIVRVSDFGTAQDGSVFLVMEWLDGESLEARLQRGPVQLEEALNLLAQAAEGLAAAHSRGVVHRDIKPSNLFLTSAHGGGVRVVVLDFGIAKLADAESKLTREGMFLGTPHYVSPEQAGLATASGVAPVDARSDIYSLGVVLYEVLTGTVPFSGDNYQAVLLARAEPPELPSSRAPTRGISRQLDALVVRSMAVEPQDRFESASELARALRQLARGDHPVSVPVHSTKEDHSHVSEPPPVLPVRRAPALAVALALCAVAAATIGVVFFTRGAAETEPPAAGEAADGVRAPGSDTGELAEEAYERTVSSDALDYHVRVTPGLAEVGEPLRIAVQLDAESAIAARAAKAQVTLEHYLQHRRVLETLTLVRDGNLAVSFSPPLAGKYHVTVALLDGERTLDRTRFDVCVGARPDSPEAADLCPRMD